MKKGVVNLLTPSYNNAGLIPRLLDSVLEQTYPLIEMMVIDDGSTDNTKEVIESYQPRFKDRGYVLHYEYQENTGLSGTINNGLKLVTGEYLLWPDADDWYATPHSIEKMVEALKNSDKSVGMVRCGCQYVDEIDGSVNDQTEYTTCTSPQYIFEDALYLKNHFRYTAGAVAVKCCFLDRFITNRTIFTSKYGGQNIQLYYPYLRYSKCITVNEYLYNILIRSNSHGRGSAKTYEEIKRRSYDYFQTYEQTLLGLNMSDEEKEKCLCFCRMHHFISGFNLACKYGEVNDIRMCYHELRNLNYQFSAEDILRLDLCKIPKGNQMYNFGLKVKSKLMSLFGKFQGNDKH